LVGDLQKDRAAVDPVVEGAGGAEIAIAVQLDAGLRQQKVAVGRRIDRLRQQHDTVRRVDVGDVVVQPERQLDASGANAEPVLPPIVEIEPIDVGLVVSDRAEVAGEQLDPDSELVGHSAGDVEPDLGELEAALLRLGEIVVVGRDQEPLAHEPV
jgi:hypothetical protein